MLIEQGARLFDYIRGLWKLPRAAKLISLALIYAFLLTGCAIVLNLLGAVPPPFNTLLPTNPFQAIQLAFSLVLGIEVIELIFAISDSVSRAVGKQLEIMALLLLRETFTDISLLTSPINPGQDYPHLLQILATALGGLSLFVLRGIFAKWRYSQEYKDVSSYINAKKCVSLFLFLIFFGAGAYDIYGIFVLHNKALFFQIFYTALIFTDILLVLAGQYYMPSFSSTFRNSGYAVGTLIMRMALGAPHYLGAIFCVFAGLYILGLTWAAARFTPPEKQSPPKEGL